MLGKVHVLTMDWFVVLNAESITKVTSVRAKQVIKITGKIPCTRYTFFPPGEDWGK